MPPTLYLIRHAQAIHNVDVSAPLAESINLFDLISSAGRDRRGDF
jgi:broad specificity phosphatase PhoE